MSNLRIALVQERADQVYYAGNTITGSLMLDVAEPKGYQHVSIQFIGKSYVHWTESRTQGSGDNQRTVTYSYTSSEPYVDLGATLWSSQQSPDGKLHPAQYNWPFRFEIPPNVPCSFEGSVGHIRYELQGRISTGLLKFDQVAEVRIPVQQLVSITDPRLLQPQRQETQKTLCCLCCASQPIILNVSVPKTGFCIGESFPLHVSIENGSTRRITINAVIGQQVLYTAEGHHNWGKKTLICVGSDQIEPRATREWDPTIQVPPAEIVHESACRNIKVTYSLTVTARIPRALNLTTTIPLQLGNCTVGQNPSLPTQPPPQQGPLLSTQPGTFPPGPTGQQPAGYPPSGVPYLAPPGQPGSTYSPPPTSAAYPPQPLPGPSAAYPPQPLPGPSAATTIGWSTQFNPNVPPSAGASGLPPSVFEKPPDTLADIPAPSTDHEKKPL